MVVGTGGGERVAKRVRECAVADENSARSRVVTAAARTGIAVMDSGVCGVGPCGTGSTF